MQIYNLYCFKKIQVYFIERRGIVMEIKKDKFILFDGAMGTMLQKYGLEAGELPEKLNLTNPEIIKRIHLEYVNAGAEVITTNTFGANSRKFNQDIKAVDVIKSGVQLAKESGAKYVALDVGPTGALLQPLGLLSFEDAYDIFKEQIIAGSKSGADIILIETMSDLYEVKAAVLAAKENCNLPIICTMTFAEDGRTFLGTDPKTAVITLCGLGVDAVGINCSLGPELIIPFIDEMMEYSTVPVIVQANAGLPKIENGFTTYDIIPEQYTNSIEKMIDKGVTIIGGCCGTTPEYIAKIKELLERKTPQKREIKKVTAITSPQKTVILEDNIAIIGERINPTGKKLLKEALKNKNYEYVMNEAITQQENGADILDVNAGLPEIDEKETMVKLVKDLQGIISLPLQIDSADASVIEAAVRVYNGKPIINSVNGKEESLQKILPIAKKYGAAVVGLTLDDTGIPDKAEDRFKIAEKILNRALALGIPKEDILIDCLTMTASANQAIVLETLKAIQLVKSKLGLKTVLGVSNVSFGLPNRENINATFLAAAFGAGLDMPILNPSSSEYMKIVATYKVLNNEDKGAEGYISKFSEVVQTSVAESEKLDVKTIIFTGRKSQIAQAAKELLEKYDTMTVINDYFIPALDVVGEKFEKGEFFLPQLMASAETVKAGMDYIKQLTLSTSSETKGKILLATVKGDIHDIGKNIVKMLLENYGYDIVDLGKDVEPELIVKTVLEQSIKLVGLSALMTTTVKYMDETIKELHKAGANCKIMVGGAVLNEEYAKMVGADFYAKDAAESAKIAALVLE